MLGLGSFEKKNLKNFEIDDGYFQVLLDIILLRIIAKNN